MPEPLPPLEQPTETPGGGSWIEVFLVFLRLGMTSFGGPLAHLAYFREEFVARRRWIGEAAFAELVSLCQFLPGPASSQVGIALGFQRAGMAGACAAWVAFTAPSAALMTAFALGLLDQRDWAAAGWASGLKVFAVAVVAHAVWGMARALCPDFARRAIALGIAALLLLASSASMQLVAMAISAAAGIVLLRHLPQPAHAALRVGLSRVKGAVALVLFALLLFAGAPLADWLQIDALELFALFYRVGALVFGGGHVVLPLLQAEVVPSGWISQDVFLAGYAAAQMVPGPLFSFAAFLGAAVPLPGGVAGAAVALVGIFVPAFLLVLGALPFWQDALQRPALRTAVAGVNAGVVGLLGAALITPIGTSALHSLADAAFALVVLIVLLDRRLPVWAVAVGSAVAGALMH